MNHQQRFEICAHEAGHAIAAIVLNGRRVEGLHVCRDACGYVDFGKLPGDRDDIREKFETLIQTSAAGQAAGRKAAFIPWTIAGNPPPHKRKNPPKKLIADRQVSFTKINNHAPDTPTDDEEEERLAKAVFPESWRPYRYWLAHRAKVIVDQQWPIIMAVATRLFHQSYVSREEFLQIIKNTKKGKA